MSRLTDLLARLAATDPAMARDLREEVDALESRRQFGLNFERHAPETVELPGRPVRKGDKVRVLPPRGVPRTAADRELWRVVGFPKRNGDDRLATLESLGDGRESVVAVKDVVVVAEFRDSIYPGLVAKDRIERGERTDPYHVVIDAENYHALELLLFTHRRKVDAIYIDPPYNTGDKSWKYDNCYVESDDVYRHSKWLAMMERRLNLAKLLLNPEDSVLIVTIDEREYLRLGLLLSQVFPDAEMQMITTAIKPSGSQRSDEFSRVEEYVYFLRFGDAYPSTSTTDMLRDAEQDSENSLASVTWQGLRRRGSTDWKRESRPNGFYPIFVDKETGKIHSVGDSIPLLADRSSVIAPYGTYAAWPLDPRGEEGRWQVSPTRLREQLAEGTAALRKSDEETETASVVYLKGGDLAAVRSGAFETDGLDDEGKLIVIPTALATRKPKTMWVMPSHDASAHGTALLSRFLPNRKFPFPKSLYAVEDALRFFVGKKPSAVILDFFAGSGTTAHAVMRLNHQDGGHRQAILVTNNEVSAAEARDLSREGSRAGDVDWETLGIAEYITWPRVKAAISGTTPDGVEIRGEYKFTDEFPMKDGFTANAEFFKMTYEAPLRVASNREFPKIAPILWLRAGARGRRIDDISKGWDVADAYGVIVDLNQSVPFVDAVTERDPGSRNDEEIERTGFIAFIVTDEDRLYESVARELPEDVEKVRLYEAYLRNFELVGRGV